MKTLGIVAEYNPFHSGHAYHINEAKHLTGSDCAVIVMSGDFVQRGAPAILDKYTRTEMSLNGGADVVIELPSVYAVSSAENFSRGAISILNSIGNIDFLSFGMEYGSTEDLQNIANLLLHEPEELSSLISKYMKEGLTLPAARSKALLAYLDDECLNRVITSPNNILAVEYLKALKYFNSDIKPCAVRRLSDNYHEINLDNSFSSATAIRNAINTGRIEECSKYMLTNNMEILNKYNKLRFPVNENDFSELLQYRLMSDQDNLHNIYDISENLSNSIKRLLSNNSFESFSSVTATLKSRNYTYTRISRSLIHALLGITDELVNDCNNSGYAGYAKILGFSKTGREFLNKAKKDSQIPLLTKSSDIDKKVQEPFKSMLKKDVYAAQIYNLIVKYKFGFLLKDDYRNNAIIKR